MLLIRNAAALNTPVSMPAAATIIPFDTTVLSTNGAAALSNNAVSITTPGIYSTACQVLLSNSAAAAVAVTLTAYADGQAIPGALMETTVPAGGSAPLSLEWTQKIVNAQSGMASASWYLSGGAVNLDNAIASVTRIV